MPRIRTRLKPAVEPVPDWWAAEFFKRQSRARTSILRVLQRAGRAMSRSEVYGQQNFYGPEFNHAVQSLIASGLIRVFVRREPYTSAFKVSLGVESEIVDRTYYELTEQPS